MVGQLPPPEKLRPKGIADVVFCIDSTGSMGPCIDGVKENVQKLVSGFDDSKNQVRLDWRVRLLAYRDLNHGEETQRFPFTDDIETFRGQVASLMATGGGDEPESTLDVLFEALNSDWREQCNKCIVVFTDAPPHHQMHSSTVQPGQPRDVDEVINKIIEKRAYVFLFAPAADIYDEIAAAPRVLYEVHTALGLSSVDFAKLMEHVGKTVTATTVPVREEAVDV